MFNTKYIFSLLLLMIGSSTVAMNQANLAQLFVAMNIALQEAHLQEKPQRIALLENKKKNKFQNNQLPKHEKRSMTKGKFIRK